MRAAIFDEPFSLRIAEAPKPVPGQGEVLVRVRAAGLCAGDLYIYTGKNPYVTYPRIGCHEIAGVVEAYGPGTSGPAIGTRVVVDPLRRLRPLLSLPARQAQLLRQPHHCWRSSRGRLCGLRHGAGSEPECCARQYYRFRGCLRGAGGDRRAGVPARRGHG
ncbi:alcohol dehydrogenase catalytic domain-containing protein [Mesorhizobium sp. INR15]|uniref:alcohol dehydrogenase catalytic domain-containing protein n=1 Tax=Mesorhizobium sp. INR15 TaxID=2654248 RepID=UPI0035BC3A63